MRVIGDHGTARGVDENVFRLEVTVHNEAGVVQMLEARDDAERDRGESLWRQASRVIRFHESEQIAIREIVEEKADRQAGLKFSQQAEDIVVKAYGFERVGFVAYSLEMRRIQDNLLLRVVFHSMLIKPARRKREKEQKRSLHSISLDSIFPIDRKKN